MELLNEGGVVFRSEKLGNKSLPREAGFLRGPRAPPLWVASEDVGPYRLAIGVPARASLSGTGRIEGTVRLAGDELPRATRVANTMDPEVCGRAHTWRTS